MNANKPIDLNCDLGEQETLDLCEKDKVLMPFLSRCNIACAAHAGNIEVIRETLSNAQEYNLKCGAHPSYPDRKNFGRRSLDITFVKLADSLRNQIDLLIDCATALSINLTHIKFHGALYTNAETDAVLASKLAELIAHHYPQLQLLGLAGGAMQIAAQEFQIAFIREGFIDRAYQSNNQLASRQLAGAVYQDITQAIDQGIALSTGAQITSITGELISPEVDSLCIHGDNDNAFAIAEGLYQKLVALGVTIQ